MGCLVVNTFLLRNPDLKLAGVIFSAPFFGFADSLGVTWFKKILLKTVNPILKVSFPYHSTLEFPNPEPPKNSQCLGPPQLHANFTNKQKVATLPQF